MDIDDKTKTLMLREQIDYLLQPIGMKVVCIRYQHSLLDQVGPFKFVDVNSSLDVTCDREPLSWMVVFGSINRVIEQLGKIRSFRLFNNKIKNPYYGCRSLEEMQIRCDLLGT